MNNRHSNIHDHSSVRINTYKARAKTDASPNLYTETT